MEVCNGNPVLNALLDNFSPKFLAFHMPKPVSKMVDNATTKMMPFIGAKNKRIEYNMLLRYIFIFAIVAFWVYLAECF